MSEGGKELLAALDATTPAEFDEVAEQKGDLTKVDVPHSTDKRPSLYASAYTHKWHYRGKAKKDRRKMAKTSRRKNRRKKK